MGLLTHLYKKMFIKRYDDDGIVKYFSYTDFPELEAKPIEFYTPEQNHIKGYIYSYANPDKEHLVIFCHGIGGGHRSYMREIETLARAGLEVVAYDNTGCFESTGENIRGFTEALNCLVSCINFLKENKYLKNRKLSVVGHSWGGYIAGNILNYYKGIHSISVISGFVSLKVFTDLTNKLLTRSVYRFEKKANPQYVDSSSLDAFKTTNANVLIVHSKDDDIVKYDVGAGYLQKYLEPKPNIKYLILDGKKHEPQYTKEASKYFYSFFEEYPVLIKKKVLKTKEDRIAYVNKFDFWKMTEQDKEVWDEIIKNIKQK